MSTILDDVLSGEARWIIAKGDNQDLLPFIPDESIDSIVCDPPAGIGFMGKTWDKAGVLGVSGGVAMPATTSGRNPSCRACGGRKRAGPMTRRCACTVPDWNDVEHRLADREKFVAALTKTFREALRVLKPGGHAFVWALPRTSSWTARALEDAGFELRDCVVHHLFGSGFPKSLDVSKAIDKAAGADREVVGVDAERAARLVNQMGPSQGDPEADGRWRNGSRSADITAPATDDAKRWSGWGTALKPSQEHWILARKPLIGTVVQNVLKHGTGAINVDACRIETADKYNRAPAVSGFSGIYGYQPGSGRMSDAANVGRWPPNAVFSHAPCCREVGERKVRGGNDPRGKDGRIHQGGQFEESGGLRHGYESQHAGFAATDGTETITAWECLAACVCGLNTRAPAGGEPPMCECGDRMVWACPVAELDRQSGDRPSGGVTHQPTRSGYGYSPERDSGTSVQRPPDSGGASRFFPVFQPFIYAAKASASEKNDGLDEKNTHSTVKNQELMRRLCRMITPPGGIVLDCYAGSGSTGVAALAEGFRFVGIEREAKHVAEGRARCARAERDLAEERSGQIKMFAPPVPAPAASAVAPSVPEAPPQQSLFDMGPKR